MAVRERDCRRCGDTFVPFVSAKRYCSLTCQQAAHEDRRASRRKLGRSADEAINCRNCQKPFRRTNYAVWHCSGACSIEARSRRKKASVVAWRAARFQKARPGGMTTCPRCGIEFKTTRLDVRYCSDDCVRRRRSTYPIVRDVPVVAAPVDEDVAPLLVVACALPECGEEFQQKQANQRYCCIRHRQRHTRSVSYRAEQGKPPIQSGKPSRDEFKETMREALAHVSKVHKAGFLSAGFTEANPREVAAPGPTGCPHCRAYGRDTLGRVVHSPWCREVL